MCLFSVYSCYFDYNCLACFHLMEGFSFYSSKRILVLLVFKKLPSRQTKKLGQIWYLYNLLCNSFEKRSFALFFERPMIDVGKNVLCFIFFNVLYYMCKRTSQVHRFIFGCLIPILLVRKETSQVLGVFVATTLFL